MEKSKRQFTSQDLSRIHSKEAKQNGGKVGSDSFTSRIQRTIATQESSGVLKPSKEIMQKIVTKLMNEARMDDDFE